MKTVPTVLKATVYLKSGQKFTAEFSEDVSFNASSLTSAVVHKLVDKGVARFVQGDNIAYIEVF